MRIHWIAVAVIGASSTSATACSKKAEVPKAETVQLSKVPLDVQLPPGWAQSQNTPDWIVYRPPGQGAFVAMSGERSCTLVEKRLYSALMELGLDQVMWQSAPRPTTIQGLRATVAEGTAMNATRPTRLKYSVVRADGNMGCLVTLVAYWQSNELEAGPVADRIIRSVTPRP